MIPYPIDTVEHTMTDTAAAPFAAKARTRAAGTFLAVATPEEFFASPKHLVSLTRTVGGRFARRQKFYRREDVAQDAAVVALEAARRWTPEHGVPFGGFAYRSALLWCTGAMHRASIPVGGCETRAETEAVRYSSLDAPRLTASGTVATLGETLDESKVVGGRSTRPDDGALTREILADFRAATADLSDEVFDAVVAIMVDGRVDPRDIPAGWTDVTLTRLADRVRAELRLRADVRAVTPPVAPSGAPAYNPWG